LGDEQNQSKSFWASAIEAAAKFDKDTFIFSLIVIAAFLALIANVPFWTTIVAAIVLLCSYALFRSWMLQTQFKEKLFDLKAGTPERAAKLAEDLSTEEEKKLMREYAEALEYKLSQDMENGR
jgi:Ca2+/Na+ antiporter